MEIATKSNGMSRWWFGFHLAILIFGIVPVATSLLDLGNPLSQTVKAVAYAANLLGLFVILQLRGRGKFERLTDCADQLWIGSMLRLALLTTSPLNLVFSLALYYALVILLMACFSRDTIRERLRYLWLIAV